MDLAILVDAQGEMLDNIETNVSLYQPKGPNHYIKVINTYH